MKSICWKLVIDVFPLFWWISHLNQKKSTRAHFCLNENSKSYYYTTSAFDAYPSYRLIALITEMTSVMRILELPKLSVEDLEHVGNACIKIHQNLEAIVKTTSKERLSVFDLPFHLLLHLQDTIKHCGMPPEYWTFPIKRVVDDMKSLPTPHRQPTVLLSQKFGLRVCRQIMFSPVRLKLKFGVKAANLNQKCQLEEICFKAHCRLSTPANVDDKAYSSFEEAIKMRCRHYQLNEDLEQMIFYKPLSFTICGDLCDVAVHRTQIVKVYGYNNIPIYGRCLRLLVVKIATPDGPFTMNLVLLEELKPFPLIMFSDLWLEAPSNHGDQRTPITIGQLVHKNGSGPKCLLVIDAARICSKCYTIPVPVDLARGDKDKFEYLFDSKPFTIGEILRKSTQEEQAEHIYNAER